MHSGRSRLILSATARALTGMVFFAASVRPSWGRSPVASLVLIAGYRQTSKSHRHHSQHRLWRITGNRTSDQACDLASLFVQARTSTICAAQRASNKPFEIRGRCSARQRWRHLSHLQGVSRPGRGRSHHRQSHRARKSTRRYGDQRRITVGFPACQ